MVYSASVGQEHCYGGYATTFPIFVHSHDEPPTGGKSFATWDEAYEYGMKLSIAAAIECDADMIKSRNEEQE